MDRYNNGRRLTPLRAAASSCISDFVNATSITSQCSSLLLVNRQVKKEVTAVFRKRNIFFFQSSVVVYRLLVYGASYWGHSSCRLHCPNIFLKIGHLSVLHQRTVHMNRYHQNQPGWLSRAGRKITLYCSSAHADVWRRSTQEWRHFFVTYEPAAYRFAVWRSRPCCCLIFLLCRQLRRLRGVNVHFAFVPEHAMLEGLTLKDGKPQQELRWLAESADTDIVLPIYETYQEIVPLAVAPLWCLAAAIRREVASTNTSTISTDRCQ